MSDKTQKRLVSMLRKMGYRLEDADGWCLLGEKLVDDHRLDEAEAAYTGHWSSDPSMQMLGVTWAHCS